MSSSAEAAVDSLPSSDLLPISLGPDVDPTSLSSSAAGVGHGWQKVTNPRKSKSKPGEETANPKSAKGGKESSSAIFSTVEREAKERRMRIEARLQTEAALGIEGVDYDEEEEEEGLEAASRGAVDSSDAAAGSGGEASKKDKKPKKPKVTVAEAASAIDPDSLSAFLTEINESFADLPDVQLMRCVDFFARAFAEVSPSLFSVQKAVKDSSLVKALEMPYSSIPENIVSVASDWLLTKPVEQLGKFAVFLIKAALEDAPAALVAGAKSSKIQNATSAPAKAKCGMLVLLSIVLRKKSDVLHGQQQELSEISKNLQNLSQERLLVLSWAFGQCAKSDLIAGMWLWSRFLFLPFSQGKLSTPLTRDTLLTFFESVLLSNPKKARVQFLSGAFRRGERLISPLALHTFLSLSFPPSDVSVTKATPRFSQTFPLIKEIGLAGAHRSKTTKPAALDLFPLAFSTISKGGKDFLTSPLSFESCQMCLWALSQNADCFKQWEKRHLEDTESSSLFLSFLLSELKAVKNQLGENVLGERVGERKGGAEGGPGESSSQPVSSMKDLKRCLLRLKETNSAAIEATTKGNSKSSTPLLPPTLSLPSLQRADVALNRLLAKLSVWNSCMNSALLFGSVAVMAYGFYLLSPSQNPWKWDGYILLSKTHRFI